MPVPGYDPDDVEQLIETTINAEFDHGELSQHLSDEQLERIKAGERVVDIADDETVQELLDGRA